MLRRDTACAAPVAFALAVCGAGAARASPPPDADERAWEEISYGVGEVNFSAVALDPDKPGRVYAAAQGRLFVSPDGGQTWNETFSLRRSSGVKRAGTDAVRAARARKQQREDLRDEAGEEKRDELVEERTEEITEELVDELGDFGEELAEDIAQDQAEEEVDEEQETTEGEIARDLDKIAPAPTEDDEDAGEGAGAEETGGAARRLKALAEETGARRIHRIVTAPGGRVLLCTGRGLYRSNDAGETFEELAFGTGTERDLRAAAFDPTDPGRLYAGTAAGLFISRDGGETFAEVPGRLAELAVRDLAVGAGGVFAATSRGVYASDAAGPEGEHWVESLAPPGENQRDFSAVAADPQTPQLVFAGSEAGLYRSADGGASWDLLEPSGLTEPRVTDLELRRWGLVAATRKGVFWSEDRGARFEELYAGLDARDVRTLAAGAPLELYAATPQGLYAHRVSAARAERRKALAEVQRLALHEPTVAQVMDRALRAAWLEADLYAGWVSRARLSPLAPRVSLRATLTPRLRDFRSFPGDAPSAITRDQRSEWTAFGWAEWDLQKLFDPSPETAAGRTWRRVRRQRERILDRVNNTFLARRRLQIALAQDPPDELHALILKVLRVEELTARLDALTDGWFSQNIRQESP